MPRNPDMPCADCGKPMWRGRTSLPPGQARCWDCRRGALEHGTRRMYRGQKCRCEACRLWAAEMMRKYRASRKAATGLAQKRRASRTYESPDEIRPCSACGLPVVGKVRSDSPTHNACRPPRNWANAIQVSKRVRLEIYERDGWTCQICLTAVDPTLDPNDRMSATLDHITPRALTLFPDDSPENLRLAHRACNSARGVRAA